jgi:predicted unusual protein kinase regulating ubiquinone biosynthesis (AarF/ABC1/UbiB family)
MIGGFLTGVWHFLRIGRVQFLLVTSYLWVWFRRRIGLPHKPEALSQLHRRHAQRFRRASSELKGAHIKVGQLASLQAHLLPPEYIEEFKALRDEVQPTSYGRIATLIRHELGQDPHAIYDTFDETPIAAASMAQVHRARLRSGEEVAVKILHPGLERSVAIDLWLTRRLVSVLRCFVRRIDLWQLYREAHEALYRELDLVQEGRATEELAAALVDLEVKVPKVYWELSTSRLLTLEFIEGVGIDQRAQLDAWNVDRKALITTYLNAFFRQAFEGGYFHCDPHPGNAFCTPDGQLALLDFGMVHRISEQVRVGLLKEILGGFFRNPKMYADGLIERGIVDERERERLEDFAEHTFNDEKMRATIFDHEAEGTADVTRVLAQIHRLLKELETFRTPQNHLMFVRALGIVIDVTREVYPEESVSDLVRPRIEPVFMRFLQEYSTAAAATSTP